MQFSYILLFVIAGFSCGLTPANYEPKIVKGYPASKAVLRSTVALTNPVAAALGRSACTGTLVGSRTVVTAAHCVNDSLSHAAFGPTVNELQLIPIRAQFGHPDFGETPTPHNDIAVFILASTPPPPYTPVRMHEGELYIDDEVVVAGYGVTRFGNPASDTGTARQADVRVRAITIAPYEIIADGDNGEDTCQGDSGGPMYVRNQVGEYKLVGVTSWGSGCGREGHYTDVRYFVDWVRNTARSIGQCVP